MKIDYTVENVSSAIRQLEEYAKSISNGTTGKVTRFIKLLADKGIEVAQERVAKGTHHMPERITFKKEVQSSQGSAVCIITGTGNTIVSDWFDADGIEHIDEVFPLAMMEFGSAGNALEPQTAYGGYGGRGTFSVSGNEWKTEWYVNKVTDNGEMVRRRATAIEPTRPMYNAMLEMQREIVNCAQEVFGSQ